MKRIGSPKNGNICAFLPNFASRRYALLEKRPPQVSVDAGGAKGGTEKVRSFVTFLSGWTPLFKKLSFF